VEAGKSVSKGTFRHWANGWRQPAGTEPSVQGWTYQPADPDRSPLAPIRTGPKIPKRKDNPKSAFTGRWHVVSMDEWDVDYVNEKGPAFIEFEANGTGQFQFGYVEGLGLATWHTGRAASRGVDEGRDRWSRPDCKDGPGLGSS
jgi:hypothetical protein